MKKIFYILLFIYINFSSKVFAIDTGIFGSCKSKAQIRNGDFKVDDITCIINYAIDFFMGIAGTISVIFIIVGAYQIVFGELAKTKEKGKTTVFYAIGGFVLAAFSWLIIKFILDNFG